MDAYQQSHRYMRPPQPPSLPPSSADPHLYNHQQRPPAPLQASWYPNQFQYHPSPSSHSPSPPPQWALQPPPPPPTHHSDHHVHPYPQPPPPPHPYPAHLPAQNHQFLPPSRPPMPPPPPPHSQFPQSYPQPNQEWGNPNWAHQQGRDHQVHNNGEDWGAKARAWAAAKAAMENIHPQSQFTPVGRVEDQTHFHDQYTQTADSHYLDMQQQTLSALNYQQFQSPAAPSHRPPMLYAQEAASSGSGMSSYVSDGHLSYGVRDGTSAGDPNAVYPHQQTLPTSPSSHQQEVPSSYSSVTGKEDTADQTKMYKSLPSPISSTQEGQHHVQPSLPGVSRSVLIEQPFVYRNQTADPTADLSDQPLDFAPRFNREHDPHMQSNYSAHHDPASVVHSINSWTSPVVPGVVYPPIPAVHPSGPQHDPSMATAPVSGPAAPSFGRFPGPGPNFQPTGPPAGAPFSIGAGTALHPAAFSGDAFGVSSVSERPKKASVPNWLKEEIIKNASVITKSSLEHPKEETQSIEDEGVDKSFGKVDQVDSKSIESSRSTEEDDDDEDYTEAARTAAINQEIKRILTEVLLKVTDELFDEIATKVLREDDLTVEVEHGTITADHKFSPSPSSVPTPKASARVLVPVKAKEPDDKGAIEKSSSSPQGDVLGLANYASDDDDDDGGDDEVQSSSMPNSRENSFQLSNINKFSDDMHVAADNGSVKVTLEEHGEGQTISESDLRKTSSIEYEDNKKAANKLGDYMMEGEYEHAYSSKMVSREKEDEVINDGKASDGYVGSGSKDVKFEQAGENAGVKKSTMDVSQVTENRVKSDQSDKDESRRSSSGKDFVKDVESGRNKADEKHDESHRRQDAKHPRKEKTDDRNGTKAKIKEQGVKAQEKAKESESRKRSTQLDVKEERKDTKNLQRTSGKEDNDKRREKAKDKEDDRARHKLTSDSSRNKRRRSSSVSSRGRHSKDTSVSHANDSSDEVSDDSRRKRHSRKRNLSPSPARSRRRQVSRSPHSKHSQRRHSPYSSIESTRGRRRSRSRSPVRRQR